MAQSFIAVCLGPNQETNLLPEEQRHWGWRPRGAEGSAPEQTERRIQRRELGGGWGEHGGKIFKQQQLNFQETLLKNTRQQVACWIPGTGLSFRVEPELPRGVLEEKHRPQSRRSWGLRHAAVTFQAQGTIQRCSYQAQYIERMLGLKKKKKAVVGLLGG